MCCFVLSVDHSVGDIGPGTMYFWTIEAGLKCFIKAKIHQEFCRLIEERKEIHIAVSTPVGRPALAFYTGAHLLFLKQFVAPSHSDQPQSSLERSSSTAWLITEKQHAVALFIRCLSIFYFSPNHTIGQIYVLEVSTVDKRWVEFTMSCNICACSDFGFCKLSPLRTGFT